MLMSSASAAFLIFLNSARFTQIRTWNFRTSLSGFFGLPRFLLAIAVL